MRIRPATIEDAATIAGVHVRAWQSAYADVLPKDALARLSVDARAELWRSILRDRREDRRVWVAEEGDAIIGFASSGRSRDPHDDAWTAEVYTIYLEPSATGTGRGRSLLAHVVEDLRDRGFRRAELWVLAANERARRFYEAAGWSTDGSEKSETLDGIKLLEVRYFVEL